MNNRSRLVSLVVALALSLSLHVSSAFAEGNTPESVVKGFAKAYYMLDASMGDFLSAEARVDEDDVNMVERFLRLKEDEAKGRGYEMSYLQMHPVLLKTEVVEMDEDAAVVRLNTTALRSINPFYRMFGYMFGLIKEHHFETVYTLIKEDGAWKLGPGALGYI